MRHLQATYLPGRNYLGVLEKPFVDCNLYTAAFKDFGRGLTGFGVIPAVAWTCLLNFQVEDVILFPFGIGPRQLLCKENVAKRM